MSPEQITVEIDDCWNQKGVWAAKEHRCQRLVDYGHCRNCPVYSQTGRALLQRAMSEEYRQELDAFYQAPQATEEIKLKKAFIFRTGHEWLGLRSSLIQEVVDMGPIHSIPHKSSRIFRGIVNIRGRLELCVSIGGVLRIERAPKPPGNLIAERLIVAAKGGQSVVFPVSEVLGPIQYNPSELTPLPVTVSGSKAVYTRGMLRLRDRDVGLLDDALLFRILTRNLG